FLSVAPHLRQAAHLQGVLTTPAAAKEVRIFRLSRLLIGRYRRELTEVDREQTRAQLRAEAVKLAGWLPFAAAYVGAIWLVAAHVGSGHATAGDLILAIILGAQVNAQVAEAATMTATVTNISTLLGHRRWL